MFQGLRTNSLFYVLDKGENPNLRVGQVVSVSNPQTKYPTFNNGFTPQPMETVVDVKVKLGDEEVDFKQLPANGQIANDKNLVVSDNKDAMSADEICHALSDIGCNGNPLSEAYEHLIKESTDRGLTYSNLSGRRSVLAIGECKSDGSIINTIGHELLHVVAHICEQDGIDMMSEEPCYIMGGLCEQLFQVVQQ